MSEHFVVAISRTSGPPKIPEAKQREIVTTYMSGYKTTDKVWCMFFASPAAFFVWLQGLGERVVISAISENRAAADGEPLPTWDVEIYDDYRE